MNSKIVLVGKAAAGKDYLRKRFMHRNFTYGVSCTTRSPRVKAREVHGKDYYFMTEEEFITLVDSGEMLEYQKFNGWYYGITKQEFERRSKVEQEISDIEEKRLTLFEQIRKLKQQQSDEVLDQIKKEDDVRTAAQEKANALIWYLFKGE